MRRDKITVKKRFEILERDGFKCRYCGTPSSVAELFIDHVVPLRLGGTGDRWNLAAACEPCNLSKGAHMPLLETVKEVRQAELRYRKKRSRNVGPCHCCGRPAIRPQADLMYECTPCQTLLLKTYCAGMGVTVKEFLA